MASVIFLDGESKSGKTAVGRAIVERLNVAGLTSRDVVAGHYFRRLTLLALAARPNDASDNLDWLAPAVAAALKSDEIYNLDYDASQLEDPDVEALVSSVGQLDFVQEAAKKWRTVSAERALASGARVILFDGRNLRSKLAAWLASADVTVALELVIFCRASEAARRYLSDEGNSSPTPAELVAATEVIKDRRQQDRTRREAAYRDPVNPVELNAGHDNIVNSLELAFSLDVTNPPLPITFDNSEVSHHDGLATVSELAMLAVKRIS